jgi:hypothetical protein
MIQGAGVPLAKEKGQVTAAARIASRLRIVAQGTEKLDVGVLPHLPPVKSDSLLTVHSVVFGSLRIHTVHLQVSRGATLFAHSTQLLDDHESSALRPLSLPLAHRCLGSLSYVLAPLSTLFCKFMWRVLYLHLHCFDC